MNWDSSICRVCLKSDSESVDLHVKVELKTNYTYLDLFNSCTHLDARLDDDLPKNICRHCADDLFNSFEFLNRAISSNQFFRSSLECEKDVQYCTDSDADNYDEQELETKELSLIEIDTSTTYEENAELQEPIDYEIHSVAENTFEIVQCGQLYEDDGLIEEYDKITETKLDIEYAPSKESTNEHRKSKSDAFGSETVECKICNKTLKRWSMKHHMKRCHKKEKLQLCSACPKTFTIASDLKIHMKTHDKERKRSFICSVCRKGFFEKQSLGVHMLRHKGVREYECEICPKKFTTKKSLEVHEFTHNRQNGRFVCKYCCKRFPSKADITVHERFHTGDYPYKCDICDKSYAVKSHYTYHLAKHRGVTYKCDQCDKEFRNRGSLTSHKFKHRDRMPHECSICKKGFASPFKLNRHKCCHKSKEDDVQIE